MEKKTIGAFIAALRKANGLTQKDLAERLNVSDKTISRWERGDGDPDLASIPVLAEIFGVTCDELLRGERLSAARQEAEPEAAAISPKGEKQVQRLLTRTSSSFMNKTLICIGISAAGLLAAMICNFGFLKAHLGFFLGSFFFLASLVGQLIFANHALLAVSDDDLIPEQTQVFKRHIYARTENALHITLVLWGACFPLWLQIPDAHMGLSAQSWLHIGGLSALLWLSAAAVVRYFLNASLIRRGVMVLSEKEAMVYWRNHRLQRTCVLVLAIVTVITALGHHVSTALYGPYSIVEGTVFHDYESFKAFMEKDVPYEYHYSSVNALSAPVETSAITYYDSFGNEISEEDALKRQLILNEGTPDEQVVCEYMDRNHSVTNISYQSKADTLLPITVRTTDQVDAARQKVAVRNVLFGLAYMLEVLAALVIYRWKKARI